MRAWIHIYLKGLCMGAADILPGISGGTIALIVGIYDRLVDAIAAIDPRALAHLASPFDADARAAFLADLRAMDVGFLLVLGTGILSSVVLLSRVILILVEAYPAHVYAFFFGLIGGSALLIYRDVPIDTGPRLAVALGGFLFAFSVSGLAIDGAGASLATVFLVGAIAISAMILPGMSGAVILIILGHYEFMLDVLRAFVDGIGHLVLGGTSGQAVESGIVVATFVTGALVGLLTTARIVSWALATYRIATLTFLVSLMLGSLRIPVEEINRAIGIPGPVEGLGVLLAAIVGMAAVNALDRATDSLEYV